MDQAGASDGSGRIPGSQAALMMSASDLDGAAGLSGAAGMVAGTSQPPVPVPVPVPAASDVPRDQPPLGCEPDAIKLFVGNISKSVSEAELLPLFETIGKVVELVIVRDRMTRESKGSAFLWYAKREHAEEAVLQLNLRHTLPDKSGAQNRPLVLRRAQQRSRAPQAGGGMMVAAHAAPGYAQPGFPLPAMPMGYAGMDMRGIQIGYSGVDGMAQAVSVPVSRQQAVGVLDSLHSVAAVTGATVSITHVMTGMASFAVTVKGMPAQVQAATDLIGAAYFPASRAPSGMMPM